MIHLFVKQIGAEDLSTGKSRVLGSAYNLLNSNAPQRNECQLTSSPADFDNYVFAPVEEETTEDGSYSAATNIEFLQRSKDPNKYLWDNLKWKIRQDNLDSGSIEVLY